MLIIDEYKCPNCAGPIKFDSSVQKMRCVHCGAVFERKDFAEHQRGVGPGVGDDDTFDCVAASGGYPQATGVDVAVDDDTFDCASGDDASFECAASVAEGDGALWEDLESDDLTTGACPSCGAELYGDKNTVAMVCPCCGNAQIIAKRISSIMKPDYVIPFKRDKSAVQEAFAEFCEGKYLLPDAFKIKNRVESIQGVYVPFWLFDALADGWVMYEASKEVSRGKSTETQYYSIEREGSLAFENLPVDGSKKMDDKYMDAIEPFDYREMQDFHPSYLAGYTAEKYDVDAEKCKSRAAKRITKAVEEKFKYLVVNYDEVTTQCSSIKMKNIAVSYALFPVWVLNTKYNNKKYLFMMNGQTGKLAGKLPIDKSKVRKYKGICTGAIGLIFTALLYLVLMFVDHIGLIEGASSSPIAISIIAFSSLIGAAMAGFNIVSEWESEMNTVALRESALGYAVPGSLKYRVMKDTYIRSSGDLGLSLGGKSRNEDAWIDGLREKPQIADSWTEPLRRKSDDIGPWTESRSSKRSFHEVDSLNESSHNRSPDDLAW